METSNNQDIVDLLFLALYQDGKVSVEEDSMLQKALVALGWEEREQSGPSVTTAFAAAKEANASEEAKEAMLVTLTSRIKESGQSVLAMEWLGKLLASDGLDQGESWHLKRIEKML